MSIVDKIELARTYQPLTGFFIKLASSQAQFIISFSFSQPKYVLLWTPFFPMLIIWIREGNCLALKDVLCRSLKRQVKNCLRNHQILSGILFAIQTAPQPMHLRQLRLILSKLGFYFSSGIALDIDVFITVR